MVSPNTAKQWQCTTSAETIQDTYFLDRDLALQTALENNRVSTNSGQQRAQLCFYDGEAFSEAPLNLIHVPSDAFTVFFASNSLDMPTKILCRQDTDETSQSEIETIFQQMLEEIELTRADRKNHWQGYPSNKDAYFLDSRVAYQTAIQNNQVFLGHPTIFGLQVCYYDGEPIDNPPPNLIHVPAEQLVDYLTDCRTRLPAEIVYPASASDDEINAGVEAFFDLLEHVKKTRESMAKEFFNAASRLHPEFSADEPLRIYFLTDRRTQVLQYSAKNLAKAFEKLGHTSFVSVEQNAMEDLDSAWHLYSYTELNPHITVNLNHPNNEWLADEVFNFVWWQDPTELIVKGENIPWRKRDIAFSAYEQFDPLIKKTGMQEVIRQGFCIDSETYHSDYPIERKRKAVFVGSSYRPQLKIASASVMKCIDKLVEHMEAGEPLTKELVENYRRQSDADHNYFYNAVFPYVVRDTAVRWLCEAPGIDVEIYGWGWEQDHVVNKYYKGELPHGEALAQKYNEAKYVLVASPHEIMSQRLAECSACGSIPVVYDVRHMSEQPHWDNECLFYRTKDALHECLTKTPANDPGNIANDYTFDHFARRILEIVRRELAK